MSSLNTDFIYTYLYHEDSPTKCLYKELHIITLYKACGKQITNNKYNNKCNVIKSEI